MHFFYWTVYFSFFSNLIVWECRSQIPGSEPTLLVQVRILEWFLQGKWYTPEGIPIIVPIVHILRCPTQVARMQKALICSMSNPGRCRPFLPYLRCFCCSSSFLFFRLISFLSLSSFLFPLFLSSLPSSSFPLFLFLVFPFPCAFRSFSCPLLVLFPPLSSFFFSLLFSVFVCNYLLLYLHEYKTMCSDIAPTGYTFVPYFFAAPFRWGSVITVNVNRTSPSFPPSLTPSLPSSFSPGLTAGELAGEARQPEQYRMMTAWWPQKRIQRCFMSLLRDWERSNLLARTFPSFCPTLTFFRPVRVRGHTT